MTPAKRFRLVSSHVVVLVGCLLASKGLIRAAELTDETSTLFSGSGNCAFCHDRSGRALTDRQGNDLSIAADWSATMMAHSFKDPLWQARMEAEVLENPRARQFIEDKCQSCHAPMARTQSKADGIPQFPFAIGRTNALAQDGVSCTLCHQIQPDQLGKPESFTGHYTIKTNREIFGPYQEVFAMPMIHHVDYVPRFGKHIQDAALCGTCHTVFTPTLDDAGKSTGQFPEQTPYLEWRNSVYAKRGQPCQDCHMPRIEEPVIISSRPPWLGTQQPFWRHQFVGGNAFMLSLFSNNAAALNVQAEPAQFAKSIQKTRNQLQHAAVVRARGEREGNSLVLRVEVENRAGHKFPTGFPYRRAWLHIQITDAAGSTLFESGQADPQGRLRAPRGDFAPHYDVINRADQVQIYEAVMGDARGKATRSLLRAANYLKDNRLPPRGFTVGGPDHEFTAVRGVPSAEQNFNADGSGRDEVTYRVDLPKSGGRITANVRLLYQTAPPEALDRLLKSSAPAAKTLSRLLAAAPKVPEVVHSVRLEL